MQPDHAFHHERANLLFLDRAGSIRVRFTPPSGGCLISAVVVGLADWGKNVRFFGNQWKLSESAETGTIVVHSDSISLQMPSHVPPAQSWNVKHISLDDVPQLHLSMHRLDGHELCKSEMEIIPVNEHISSLAQKYANVSQAVEKDVIPSLSAVRFAVFNAANDVAGKRVLVSGCGSGQELAILRDLGADAVIGIDPDPLAIALARARYAESEKLSFLGPGDELSTLDQVDLAISRHVVEHVPDKQKRQYLNDTIGALKVGGMAIFDFPNQDCPIEPHTQTLFFHQLAPQQKEMAIRYLERLASCGKFDAGTVDTLRALGDHRNVTLSEFVELLPRNTKILSSKAIDSNFEDMDIDVADTLRVQVVRLE